MAAYPPTSGEKTIMEPFFTAEPHFPRISLALEDILPRDTTSPMVQARAVYQYYVTR